MSKPILADAVQVNQTAASTIPSTKVGLWSPTSGGNAGKPHWRNSNGTDTVLGSGGGGGSTDGIKGAYDAASSTDQNIVGLSAALGPVILRNNATPIATTLFGVQNSAGTVKHLDIKSSGVEMPVARITDPTLGAYLEFLAEGNNAAAAPADGARLRNTGSNLELSVSQGAYERVATSNSFQTFTNKTISGNDNTLSDIAQASVTNLTTDLAARALTTTALTAGAGLTGGGDLSANRTFAVGAGTGITVNADDVAVDQAFAPTWTAAHTFSQAISTTQTAGVKLSTSSVATVGAQKYSLGLSFPASGWKTNATAGAQATEWMIQNRPVQGTAEPSSELVFWHSINGGAFTEMLKFDWNDGNRSTNDVDIIFQSGSSRNDIAGSRSVNIRAATAASTGGLHLIAGNVTPSVLTMGTVGMTGGVTDGAAALGGFFNAPNVANATARIFAFQAGGTDRVSWDAAGKYKNHNSANETTTATAGSNGAAPAQVKHYLSIVCADGSAGKIPVYAA